MISIGFSRFLNSQKAPTHRELWHQWNVIVPRRTITGRLVWGAVWRRRDGRRWIYKQYLPRPHA